MPDNNKNTRDEDQDIEIEPIVTTKDYLKQKRKQDYLKAKAYQKKRKAQEKEKALKEKAKQRAKRNKELLGMVGLAYEFKDSKKKDCDKD